MCMVFIYFPFEGAKSTENLVDTGDKGLHQRHADSDSISSNEWPNRPSEHLISFLLFQYPTCLVYAFSLFN